MTLASYISCLRIVLIVPIIYLLDMGFRSEAPSLFNYLAFVLFIVAGLTGDLPADYFQQAIPFVMQPVCWMHRPEGKK